MTISRRGEFEGFEISEPFKISSPDGTAGPSESITT